MSVEPAVQHGGSGHSLTYASTARYSVFISRVRDRAKLDVLTLLYYNTVITTPFLFVYVAMSGELSAAMQFEHAGDVVFQIMFVASMFLAFLLNWTTFRNTTINSPMTQTVTGQAKNFIAFLLSLVLFSDYKCVPACGWRATASTH